MNDFVDLHLALNELFPAKPLQYCQCSHTGIKGTRQSKLAISFNVVIFNSLGHPLNMTDET